MGLLTSGTFAIFLPGNHELPCLTLSLTKFASGCRFPQDTVMGVPHLSELWFFNFPELHSPKIHLPTRSFRYLCNLLVKSWWCALENFPRQLDGGHQFLTLTAFNLSAWCKGQVSQDTLKSGCFLFSNCPEYDWITKTSLKIQPWHSSWKYEEWGVGSYVAGLLNRAD
jgi:hypothetical protein